MSHLEWEGGAARWSDVSEIGEVELRLPSKGQTVVIVRHEACAKCAAFVYVGRLWYIS